MTENKPTTIIIILVLLIMLAGVGLLYSTSQQRQQELDLQAAELAEKESASTANKPDVEPKPSDSNQEKIDVDKAQEAAANSTEDTPVIAISKEDASKIATDEYGGVAKSVEDDWHKGVLTWEVEIDDSRLGKIEVEVDKATGEIVSMERD